MGKIQNVLSKIALGTKNNSYHRREGGGYTSMVQNINVVPPPPPEVHHEAIESLKTIVQGTQNQSYKKDGLAQANAVIIISN